MEQHVEFSSKSSPSDIQVSGEELKRLIKTCCGPEKYINPNEKSIVTVTSTVTYLRARRPEPKSIISNYDYFTESRQPVIFQELLADSNWQQISSKEQKCSTLVISNDEGRLLLKVPTQEERKDIESKVVLLAYKYEDSFIVLSEIPPRMNTLIHPNYTLDNYWILCRNKEASCTVLAVIE